MNILLETTRLILRPFQDSDLESFAAYRSEPEIASYQDWRAPYSLEQAVVLNMGSSNPNEVKTT